MANLTKQNVSIHVLHNFFGISQTLQLTTWADRVPNLLKSLCPFCCNSFPCIRDEFFLQNNRLVKGKVLWRIRKGPKRFQEIVKIQLFVGTNLATIWAVNGLILLLLQQLFFD